MQQTNPNDWIPADQAWMKFAADHPEFGIKPTPNSWIHFQRKHAAKLVAVGVIRRIAYRGRMLADKSKFEVAAFNLLLTGSPEAGD